MLLGRIGTFKTFPAMLVYILELVEQLSFSRRQRTPPAVRLPLPSARLPPVAGCSWLPILAGQLLEYQARACAHILPPPTSFHLPTKTDIGNFHLVVLLWVKLWPNGGKYLVWIVC